MTLSQRTIRSNFLALLFKEAIKLSKFPPIAPWTSYGIDSLSYQKRLEYLSFEEYILCAIRMFSQREEK